MGPRTQVYRSKARLKVGMHSQEKKKSLLRVGFWWVERGRRRVLQANDRTVHTKGLQGPCRSLKH